MKRLPFRSRLTVWSTIVAATSIVICGMGAAWFVHRRELSGLDAELRDDSAHFYSELGQHGGSKFDWRKVEGEMREWMPQRYPPRYIEIRTGETVRWRSKNLPEPGFANQAKGIGEVHLAGKGIRLYSAEQNGVAFVIGSELQAAESLVRGLLLALLASFPLAVAFAWFGGRRLAALAVAPVEEITAALERVTAEHLDQRVPVPMIVDEIQRHARVLNATLDRLERSYQQALRFSGDASHELKTPLTVLRSSIEAVLDSPTLEDGDRLAVSGLLEQTRRLSDITSSLLLLSRADAGCLTLDIGRHDLAELTEACAEDARIIAEQQDVRVEVELPASAPALVDPLRYSQIASNLLDNAVKYNHPGGVVRVQLTDAGSVWRLFIGNTGLGIPAEHHRKLFDRFFRVEHTVDVPGQGLGLGLARELARAHGGDVILNRSAAGWSEFCVTLPKAGARLVTARPSPPRALHSGAAR
jgi:signal transduction histidine kinase